MPASQPDGRYKWVALANTSRPPQPRRQLVRRNAPMAAMESSCVVIV